MEMLIVWEQLTRIIRDMICFTNIASSRRVKTPHGREEEVIYHDPTVTMDLDRFTVEMETARKYNS